VNAVCLEKMYLNKICCHIWHILFSSIHLDLGLRQPRLEGEEYMAVVDEFMEAVHARWPQAVVQVCVL